MRQPNLFNGPLETGLRSLIVLAEFFPLKFDLQRIILLDYIIVHSGDFEPKIHSLHGRSPLQSGEVAVRRELVSRGLLLFQSRGLIERFFDQSGISYTCSEISIDFLDAFQSKYTTLLKARTSWASTNFGHLGNSEIRIAIEATASRWAGEFAISEEIGQSDEL
jgi:hypothetical protein